MKTVLGELHGGVCVVASPAPRLFAREAGRRIHSLYTKRSVHRMMQASTTTLTGLSVTLGVCSRSAELNQNEPSRDMTWPIAPSFRCRQKTKNAVPIPTAISK